MKTIRLKIKVTKEVIKRAMWCKVGEGIMSNCAIALAIRDLFPNFIVTRIDVREYLGSHAQLIDYPIVCNVPATARMFIIQFDNLDKTPEKRLEIHPIEFEVDIPEKYFPEISEVHKILANCQTMELV